MTSGLNVFREGTVPEGAPKAEEHSWRRLVGDLIRCSGVELGGTRR